MAEEASKPIPACPPLPKDLVLTGRKPPVKPTVAVRMNREATDKPPVAAVRKTTTTASVVVVQRSGNSDVNALSVSLEDILKTFNAPISEDQAWALIYQSARMFKSQLQETCRLQDLRLPVKTRHLNVHKDGSCFVTVGDEEKDICLASSQKKVYVL